MEKDISSDLFMKLRSLIRLSSVSLLVMALAAAPAHASSPVEVVSYHYLTAPNVNRDDPDLTKLTDGVTVPDSYWSSGQPSPLGAEVGWLQNPADPEKPLPAIVFDLGEGHYLDSVRINYVLWPDAGVRAPHEVRVSVSFDGVEFLLEEIHTGFDGSNHDAGFTMYTRSLDIDLNSKPARQVKLDFRQGPGETWGPNRSSWHWLDEVSFTGTAIDNLDNPTAASLHQAVELEFPTEMGRVYQIQTSPDLAEWENWGDPILGNGGDYRLFRSIKTEGRGFFRVMTTP